MKNKKPTMLQRIQLFCTLFVLGCRKSVEPQVNFANIGEGTYSSGQRSMFGDATTASRYLMYKIGSDADHVTLAGAGDLPLGPSNDSVADVTVPLLIHVLGAVAGTVRVTTDGSIANGDPVKCAANGQVAKATTSGTDIVIGRASFGTDTTSAAGDVITLIPTIPFKHPF